MIVIYRMCGIKSTNPSPILYENKFALNKLCLRSFVDAYKDIKPYTYFIMDHCDYEYKELVQSIMSMSGFSYNYEFGNRGINETMLYAYEKAEKIGEDVLFQECDYLYRPNVGTIMQKAIAQLGLVSPYDHLNFYLDQNIHSQIVELKLVDGYHFRDTERNTMTFGIKYEIFKKNIQTFRKYGYLDDKVWGEIADTGQKLWTPIPSLATHMVEGYMSPGVDWEAIYETYL